MVTPPLGYSEEKERVPEVVVRNSISPIKDAKYKYKQKTRLNETRVHKMRSNIGSPEVSIDLGSPSDIGSTRKLSIEKKMKIVRSLNRS